MSATNRKSTSDLAPGELLTLPARAGDSLRVLSGRVLVTQEGVAEDFDLSAGAALELPVRGKVLVEAVDAASMEMRPLRRSLCEWYLSLFRPESAPTRR